MSPEASAYLDEVFELMKPNALHRDRLDWERLRWQADQLSDGAETPADTYRALTFIVSQLGDNHSAFVPADEVAMLEGEASADEAPLPRGELLGGRIGYLWLPHLVGEGDHATRYAHTAQAVIRELEATRPCGWIVDLSENMGGNMWPMLVGVGPLLGEGEAGRFVGSDGTTTSWGYRDGAAALDGTVMARIEQPTNTVHPLPPVAVLTSEQTMSSGEALAVAFRGRPDSRSFGTPTAGLSTGNESYTLSDGAVLILTTVIFADRTGAMYGASIAPDEAVQGGAAEARDRAAEWLNEQESCAGQGDK